MKLSFASTSLRIGAGLLIWAAHFGAVYIYAALVCARGDPTAELLGVPIIRLNIALLTLVAIAALAYVLRQTLRGRWRAEAERADLPFIAWLSAASALYGLLAVLWTAVPTLWVAACAPA